MATTLDGKWTFEPADGDDGEGGVLGSGRRDAAEGGHGGLLGAPVIPLLELIYGGILVANFISEEVGEGSALK